MRPQEIPDLQRGRNQCPLNALVKKVLNDGIISDRKSPKPQFSEISCDPVFKSLTQYKFGSGNLLIICPQNNYHH